MHGKVCLVTGANAGLGKAIALGLARVGATVVLACRDQARGEAALAEVKATSSSETVELLLVDLASLSSVRRAVAAFIPQHQRLDVLINNAAIFKRQRVLTMDGLETMFATNHLGPFLLTNLLLATLKAGTPARILTITAPSTSTLKFDDLQGERQFNALSAFGASKACNLLFTYELARRLEGTGVTANAIHPGLVKSSLMKEAAAPIRFFSQLVAIPPEKAAAIPVYYASSPEVEGVTGRFFRGKKAISSSVYSLDVSNQRHLWDVSERLAGL